MKLIALSLVLVAVSAMEIPADAPESPADAPESPADAPESPADAPESPVETDYHDKVGVPEAARIKAAEEAADFDGTRIVGGSQATLGQFPYQAGLLVTLTTGVTSVCGASLLTHTRSLTAAHCWRTPYAQARQFVVVLGSMFLFSGGTRVATRDVNMHAGYNVHTLVNDVAIIRMPWVNYNQYVQPVTMATGNYQYIGHWALASGFGRKYDGQSIGNSQYLSYVNMQVVPNSVCASVYGHRTVVASTLCTSTTGGRGTCGGDSGGPLVVYNEWNQAIQIGLSSFGHRSGCQRNHPAGFARITSFVRWIQARL